MPVQQTHAWRIARDMTNLATTGETVTVDFAKDVLMMGKVIDILGVHVSADESEDIEPLFLETWSQQANTSHVAGAALPYIRDLPLIRAVTALQADAFTGEKARGHIRLIRPRVVGSVYAIGSIRTEVKSVGAKVHEEVGYGIQAKLITETKSKETDVTQAVAEEIGEVKWFPDRPQLVRAYAERLAIDPPSPDPVQRATLTLGSVSLSMRGMIMPVYAITEGHPGFTVADDGLAPSRRA